MHNSDDSPLKKMLVHNDLMWDSIKILNKTKFITRMANIDIKLDHEMPVLVNEYYKIKVTIINNESFKINDIK